MVSKLEGFKIKIIVSELADFVPGTYIGRILKVGVDSENPKNEAALIQLDKPVMFENAECEFFVGATRHEGVSLESILDNEPILCNLTRISAERAASDNPLDLSWWRGGIGMICTLRKA
jgi:hypothetical protein